jgi:hypothetical protein
LQEVTPLTIQLTKLLVRGEMGMKAPPRGKEAVAKAAAEAKAKGSDPGTPVRRFFVSLYGRAAGSLADQVVLQYVRDYQQVPSLEKVLDTVKLQSLQKTYMVGSTEADSIFAIDSATRELEMK